MSFRIGIWDHCRYIINREKPYEEMVNYMERMRRAGVTLLNIYLPEVPSLDDYCRAAAVCGMQVEARITPAWAAQDIVCRTLNESEWAQMEAEYGIKISGPCGNHPENRKKFIQSAQTLAEQYQGRIHAIHLDFIRNDNALLLQDYPCRCEACQQLYERFFGTRDLNKELLKLPAVSYKLLALRNENVSRTLRAMRTLTQAHKLDLTIAARANYINSADITAPPVWGLGPAVLEGQDWVQWLDEQLIDRAYPMNYHTNMEPFCSLVNDYLRMLQDKAFSALHVGVGISSSMGENPPEEVAKRLDVLKNANLPGAMLFNKTNIYSNDYCQVIKDFAG